MAIYHLSMQVISRSKGQSAVASASYRSGEQLVDERTGETKFYKREVQPETMILSPSHAPQWVQDRNRLWNEVEKIEKRKDSQLAREINVALPRELSNEKQKELIQNFAQKEFVDKGMIADIAIHRDDKENPHAHIMLTMRTIDKDGFGKKERDWNADFANSKENNRGFVKSSENCVDVREQWSAHANQALEKEGSQERISHLSHEARGIEQLPTVHLGHVANEMEQKGIKTERGNINRDRQEYNRMVVDLQKYREEKTMLQKKVAQEKTQQNFLTPTEKVDIKKAVPIVRGFVTLDKISEREQQLDQWQQKISKSESYMDWKADAFAKAKGHLNRQQNLEKQIQQNQEQIKNINWFNPLKVKENRLTKERNELGIERLEKEHDSQDKKLDYYRDKLKFTTKDEFSIQEKTFVAEKEKSVASNFKQKQEIREQKEILSNAEKALKQGQIREITSQYPELQTSGEFMRYENAMKLKELNEKVGKTVPIEQVKKTLNARMGLTKERTEAIYNFEKTVTNAEKAESYFKQLNAIESRIEKAENNPIQKAKLMFSKEAKNDHLADLQKREQYKSAIEKIGYKDQEHLDQHKEQLDKMVPKVKELEKEIQNFETGNYDKGHGVSTDLLQAVLQSVEQAQQHESQEHQKKRRKDRTKGQKSLEIERGR